MIIWIPTGEPRPTLYEIERKVIEARLASFSGEGRKAMAAKSLGIAVKTLYNKLNEYAAADEFAMFKEKSA